MSLLLLLNAPPPANSGVGASAGAATGAAVGASLVASAASAAGVAASDVRSPAAFRITGPEDAVQLSTRSGVQPVTMLGWARIVTDRNAFSCIFSIENGSSTQYNELVTDSDGTTLLVYDHASGAVGTAGVMTVGTWYRVALVITSGAFAVYFGAQGGGALTKTTGSITNVGTNAYQGIGTTQGVPASEWFNGSLAGVRVWNAALSDAEVEAEFTADTPQRATNLLGAWFPPTMTAASALTAISGADLIDGAGSGTPAYTVEQGPTLESPAATGAASAAGVASASGTGASTAASSASSAGIAAGTGTGAALAPADGASSGSAAGAAVGAAAAPGAGDSSGVASSTGVGAAAAGGLGASAGAGAVVGTGASTAAGDGASAGAGVAAGTGAAMASSQGASAGSGATSGTGLALAGGQASSTGLGAASGVGGALFAGVGNASGTATADAAGQTAAAGSEGASAGTATASAVGAALADATGTIAGAGAAAGVGASAADAVASSSGTATVDGAALAAAAGVASSTGVGAAAGAIPNAAPVADAWGAWLMPYAESEVLDYSGKGRHLTRIEGAGGYPLTVDGKPGVVGKARRFTRTGQGTTSPFVSDHGFYASIDSTAWLDLVLGYLSVAFWVRPQSTVASGAALMHVLSVQGWGSTSGVRDGGIQVQVSRTTGRVRLVHNGQSGGGGTFPNLNITSVYSLPLDTWTHVALVRKGVNGGGFVEVDFYINGAYQETAAALVASEVALGGFPIDYADIFLGGKRNSSLTYGSYSTTPTQVFEGDLQQVVAYARELTSGEVATLAAFPGIGAGPGVASSTGTATATADGIAGALGVGNAAGVGAAVATGVASIIIPRYAFPGTLVGAAVATGLVEVYPTQTAEAGLPRPVTVRTNPNAKGTPS